jgi:hypothetical protein
VCTACHGLGPDITTGRSPEAWKKVVEEMVAMGAQGTPDDLRTVAEYLSQAFPAKRD